MHSLVWQSQSVSRTLANLLKILLLIFSLHRPIIGEDGEQIDNPILLFNVFLRKGLPAFLNRITKVKHPQKETYVKALQFEIGGW
jgi:hypothetical protein